MIDENLIISQILNNSYFRDKVFHNLKKHYFDNEENQKIFHCVKNLLQNNVNVLDRTTLLSEIKNTEKLDELLDIEFDNDNIDWLIDNTETWARIEAVNKAVLDSAQLQLGGDKDKDNSEKIYSMITDAVSVSFDKNLGSNYTKDTKERFERYRSKEDSAISTGYQLLDFHLNGGFREKTLNVIMAQSNLGKTLLMCNMTANLVARGLNGIYLTLELEEDIISRRMDSILTGIPFYDLPKYEKKAQSFFENFTGGNAYVREYPPSKASCLNIKTYFKELTLFEKFKPDFLMVDYLNLMKPNYQGKEHENLYTKYFDVSMELRELAVEYKIPVITATQVEKSAYGASNVGMQNVRGSMGIVENSDLVVALTQTEDQEEDNYISWKIVKNRFGRKNSSFLTQFDTKTLKIKEILTEEDRMNLLPHQNNMVAMPANIGGPKRFSGFK
jgi:replicative DNA helicase